MRRKVKWDAAYLLSDQQGWALQRDRHHLVGVPCYRVGPEVRQNNRHSFKSLFTSNICRFVFTCLSTPSSFHLCLLDMRRLPPHAPWQDTQMINTHCHSTQPHGGVSTDDKLLSFQQINSTCNWWKQLYKIFCCCCLRSVFTRHRGSNTRYYQVALWEM